MRNLFLVLVLANLAFAAWSAWFAAARQRRAPHRRRVAGPHARQRGAGRSAQQRCHCGAGGGGARRCRSRTRPPRSANAEPAADAAPDEPPAPPEPSAAQAAASCTSVGPFHELSQAATAAAALRNAGYQPLQRVVEGDVWSGYWVYIPAIPTEQEANEALAKVRAGVREARIPDAYVIRNSDSGNLVSLGVFSEISGVSRLRDEVRALGFEPQVVDRTRRATVYWIDVALAADQTLDFDALQPPGRIIRLEQRACEAPG